MELPYTLVIPNLQLKTLIEDFFEQRGVSKDVLAKYVYREGEDEEDEEEED